MNRRAFVSMLGLSPAVALAAPAVEATPIADTVMSATSSQTVAFDVRQIAEIMYPHLVEKMMKDTHEEMRRFERSLPRMMSDSLRRNG